jgi:uncharacterized RDD family membrane protein YckC
MTHNPFDPPSSDQARVPDPNAAPLASLGARFLAMVIDGVMASGAWLPALVCVLIDTAVGATTEAPGLLTLLGVLWWLVSMGFLLGIQWYLIATRGQTIGKRTLGIQIQLEGGGPVDFWTGVVLRNWAVKVLGVALNFVTCGFLGWLVGVVDALMIFGEDRKCLHDRIAKTRVVEGGGGWLD